MLLQSALEVMARRVVVEAGGLCEAGVVVDAVWAQLEGGVLGREHVEELLDESLHARGAGLLSLGDGRVIDVAHATERLILTHRLTGTEIAAGTLHLTPDLAAVGLLAKADGGLHTAE